MVGYVIYSPTQGFYAVNEATTTGYFVTGDDFDMARVYEDEEMAEIVCELISFHLAPDASVQGMHFRESVWYDRMVRA